MRVARRFVVQGRVQGVGFRWFVEDSARREGLAGWVMNRQDGHVEVRAEGEREAMERFERDLRRGPSRARVDHVHHWDDVPEGLTAGFVVRQSFETLDAEDTWKS